MFESTEKIKVVLVEDASVKEKIQRTAEKLTEKYSRKRQVDEAKLLKDVPKWKRVLSKIGDTLLTTICIICCLFGATSFLFKLNNLPPTIAGYSFMQISSGSMTAAGEGYRYLDAVVVKKVNPKTLNVGDVIAFYKYSQDYKLFDSKTTPEINKPYTEHSSSLTIGSFFGIPSEETKQAAKAGATLVFHRIVRIYQEEDGILWFKTKGDSNPTEDTWEVSERMVVGIHDTSPVAIGVGKFLKIFTSSFGLLLIIAIPLILMSISFVFKCIKRVQLAKLELDCVEEKRKITDPICVKNEVGFNMSKASKYKVLAQATPEQRVDYLSLLWKDGSAPNSIRKYIYRKHLTLRPIQKMLEVNRICEKMYAEGKKGEEIAKFYLKEKAKVEKEQERYKNMFKKIRNQHKQAREEAAK